MITSLGGLGIFLLGMIIMTEGLRSLAGKTLRGYLLRFTKTPLSGACMGTACTALLQSSSATTVATVGFVNAELMSFHNAVGIIVGANLGTTLTGWIVALVGFKLKLGLLAFPLVFIGAVMKLFASGRSSSVGLALAGFGLIFVGIGILQQGMSDLQGIISFDQLPGDTFFGRLQLVGIGIVFTIITQSSSAGVAATLTALFSGLIGWQQAAALVIGMDIGTTITAAMATIGGNVAARRTGYSHVIYNLGTGVMALLCIEPFMYLLESINPQIFSSNAELALVSFHSAFNFLGVVLILPFIRQFTRLIDKLIKVSPSRYTEHLDEGLLENPQQAMTAVQVSALEEYKALLTHLEVILSPDIPDSTKKDLSELQKALDETHNYLDRISTHNSQQLERLKALLKLMDHLQRLHERCDEEECRAITARESNGLIRLHQPTLALPTKLITSLHTQEWHKVNMLSHQHRSKIDTLIPDIQDAITEQIALDKLDIPQGTAQLEAIRWVQRVCGHIETINQALERSVNAAFK